MVKQDLLPEHCFCYSVIEVSYDEPGEEPLVYSYDKVVTGTGVKNAEFNLLGEILEESCPHAKSDYFLVTPRAKTVLHISNGVVIREVHYTFVG